MTRNAQFLGPQRDRLSTCLWRWGARTPIAEHTQHGGRIGCMHQRAAGWRARHMTVGPSEAFALFFKNTSGPVFRALLAGTLNPGCG